jgi:hypothetical protein
MNTKKINAAIAFSAFGGVNDSVGLPEDITEKLTPLANRLMKTKLFKQLVEESDKLEEQMQAQLFAFIEDYLNSEGV